MEQVVIYSSGCPSCTEAEQIVRKLGADPEVIDVQANPYIRQKITEALGEDTAAVMRRLRVARRRVALVAALAELAGVWSLEQQTGALSRFAEAALGAALRHLLREGARKGLIALPAADDPERDSGLVVLGMGKLGGYELNYSSDIDLIILYDPASVRVTARDGAQSFFVRLTRELVQILEAYTGDGYSFRTDLRLRPDRQES